VGYRLTPRAQSDIDEIWDFTHERWGIDQAERYVGQIRDAVVRLAGNPGVGRRCDEIRQGYSKLTVQSHVLFYREDSGDVVIVRVLHGRMDFERHLG
jgi:toxin ParE1/3/4